MLNRLPKHLPRLGLLMQEIGHPSAKALAKAMGVTERTARAWLKSDEAPRPVMLALYWLTRWGMSAIDTETHNLMQMHAGTANARGHEIRRLQSQVAALMKTGDFGAANDPLCNAEGFGLDGAKYLRAPWRPAHATHSTSCHEPRFTRPKR